MGKRVTFWIALRRKIKRAAKYLQDLERKPHLKTRCADRVSLVQAVNEDLNQSKNTYSYLELSSDSRHLVAIMREEFVKTLSLFILMFLTIASYAQDEKSKENLKYSEADFEKAVQDGNSQQFRWISFIKLSGV